MCEKAVRKWASTANGKNPNQGILSCAVFL